MIVFEYFPFINDTFNLSILECKFRRAAVDATYAVAFNLSILECKFFMEMGTGKTRTLLISPYWNVNLKIIEGAATKEDF